jgi:3-methyladenine DNA glycosylase/8-oxoguanine DNA glycosylase
VTVKEFAELMPRAQRHLARKDAVLKRIVSAVGPCTLAPGGDRFLVLTRAIVSQLISTKAALTIYGRLEATLAPEAVTPVSLMAANLRSLRKTGLSRAKALALRDLAQRVHKGKLPLDEFHDLTDEEIIEHLTAVRGIGQWTADMFLIFCLGRPDVLPVGDFGLRAGVQTAYGLPELPDRKLLAERAEAWRPYRSIATWYFWRSRGAVPQS